MKEKIKENKTLQIALSAFIVISACIILFFILSKLGEIWKLFGTIIKLFTPFIIGFVFAYLLNPLVKLFRYKVFSKLNKKKSELANVLSVLITCVLFIGLLILLFSVVIPEFLNGLKDLIEHLPGYINQIKDYLLDSVKSNDELKNMVESNYDVINEYINNFGNTIMPKVDELISILSDGVIGAVKVAFDILMGFVISIYFLANKDNYIAGIKKMTYSVFSVNRANNLIDNARHTNEIFGNFIIGKLLDGLTIGLLTFIFALILNFTNSPTLDLSYPLLIGVIIGITNMIPYFGPYIGTIPSALLILMYDPTKCFIFIIFIIALQQVDSYIIEPRLCGVKTGLKSFWVLASILFFGELFGILGMILGVPLFALIYGYLDNKITRKLTKKELPTSLDEYKDLERINSKTKKVVKSL